jgi:hypothetical protein
MSGKITAVARVSSREKNEYQPGETRLAFYAPYNDANGERIPENAAWAKYTPAFHLQMTVLDEVAEKFKDGVDYLLTFEQKDAG